MRPSGSSNQKNGNGAERRKGIQEFFPPKRKFNERKKIKGMRGESLFAQRWSRGIYFVSTKGELGYQGKFEHEKHGGQRRKGNNDGKLGGQVEGTQSLLGGKTGSKSVEGKDEEE